MAIELAAHWRTYHRALKAHEPCAFSWVAFGYRIIGAATWLREQMGCEPIDMRLPRKPYYPLIALSGAMYYGGWRNKRDRLPTSIFRRGFVSAESIPEPWDVDVFASRPKRKKTKWFKKPRAVVEGNSVLLRHKGRKVAWKVCLTEEGAVLAAARFNRKELPVSKLEVTDGEEEVGTSAQAVGD